MSPSSNTINNSNKGFTLIEISMLLIIVGLIAGGILLGRTLIKSSEVQAQIMQIVEFKAAASTFKGKYGYLPGDISELDATSFGFAPRGTHEGEGDGSGIIEGISADAAGTNRGSYQSGEALMFWVDLSKAGLIKDNLTTAMPTTIPPATPISSTYLPQAKISPNFIAVYSYMNTHYFLIANGHFIGNGTIDINNLPSVSPADAFAIDSKIDDGLPHSGNITVMFPYDDPLPVKRAMWKLETSLAVANYATGSLSPPTSAAQAKDSSCTDNNDMGGATQRYTLSVNEGNGQNCALSFRADFE